MKKLLGLFFVVLLFSCSLQPLFLPYLGQWTCEKAGFILFLDLAEDKFCRELRMEDDAGNIVVLFRTTGYFYVNDQHVTMEYKTQSTLNMTTDEMEIGPYEGEKSSVKGVYSVANNVLTITFDDKPEVYNRVLD